jgi:hypothetical protein
LYYIYTLKDSIIYKYNLVLGILGGVKKIVKTKLKKEDSMAMLRMRCVRPVMNKAEQDVVSAIAGANEDIKHIKDSMDANHENILKGLLTTCSYEEMKMIVENSNTTGGTSVDKVVNVIQKMSKRHKALDECVEYVSDVQMKYEQVLIDLYIKEYTAYNEDTGDTSFNNKSFKTMLVKALDYKEGERDARIVAGAVVVAPPQRCVTSCLNS